MKKLFIIFLCFSFCSISNVDAQDRIQGPSSGKYGDILEFTFTFANGWGNKSRYFLDYPLNDGFLEYYSSYHDQRYFYMTIKLKVVKNGPGKTNFRIRVWDELDGDRLVFEDVKELNINWSPTEKPIEGGALCPINGTTYTKTDAPAGITPIWSVGGNLEIVSGQGTGQIKVKSKSVSEGQTGVISYTAAGETISKTIAVGHMETIEYQTGNSLYKPVIFGVPGHNFTLPGSNIRMQIKGGVLHNYTCNILSGTVGNWYNYGTLVEFTLQSPTVQMQMTFNRSCCTENRLVWFHQASSYSVNTGPGMIMINKEEDCCQSENHSVDKYELIEMNTGVVKKTGILTDTYNMVESSDLNSGLYIVRIISGDKSETHKINLKK